MLKVTKGGRDVSLFFNSPWFSKFIPYLDLNFKQSKNTMELKEDKKLFDEILDLCYLTENPRLIEVADSIYNEIDNADDISKVISSCAELQIVINEIDILPEEEDSVMDIQTKIESLSE